MVDTLSLLWMIFPISLRTNSSAVSTVVPAAFVSEQAPVTEKRRCQIVDLTILSSVSVAINNSTPAHSLVAPRLITNRVVETTVLKSKTEPKINVDLNNPSSVPVYRRKSIILSIRYQSSGYNGWVALHPALSLTRPSKRTKMGHKETQSAFSTWRNRISHVFDSFPPLRIPLWFHVYTRKRTVLWSSPLCV